MLACVGVMAYCSHIETTMSIIRAGAAWIYTKALKKLKAIRYSVEAEDLDGLSKGLAASDISGRCAWRSRRRPSSMSSKPGPSRTESQK